MNTAAPGAGTTQASLRATRRAHAWFLATAAACLVVFGWMVSFGTFRFVAEDVFGNFYDHQAAAWLGGRWDVPEPALSGEAFIVDGKVYGYFGPTPALMRLPLVALGIGFGTTTRAFMLLDYAACLGASYALLWLAYRWRHASAVPTGFSVAVFTSTVGLGSTLFFLGSRAYVYHEAILCGAAFGLWSVYCALRYLQSPTTRWWFVALVGGVLAVHARPPIGLFALTVLGVVSLLHATRSWRSRVAGGSNTATTETSVARHVAVGALAVAGVLSFNAVSYLKFGTFEGCPLRFNVQYTPEKLAVLGHRNFHLANLRFNSDAYLLQPSYRISAGFPYVYREYIDRREYPESRMAYRDQTLAMPWAMPGMFALAVAGSVIAAFATPMTRLPLAVWWTAAAPAALAMLTAVAVTQRYTADFCPFLTAAGAFGLAGFGAVSPAVRTLATAALGLLAALGVLVTFLLTIHHQREIVWGVPEEVRQNYDGLRRKIDGFFADSHAR